MKKLISSRQRQYLGNYLLNLKTQAETFHVINILWFSIKVYHKFRSFNICSLFSAGRNYEGAKPTLHYMPHKNIRLPKSFIHCPWWHFQWRKFEAQYLIHVSASRLFMMYWGFCAKNIMALILKTLIWDYSWGKVKL